MNHWISEIGFFMIYATIFFVAIVIRYFITAGIFHWYYYKKNSEYFSVNKLSKRSFRKGQIKKEIYWSIISSVIFALAGALCYEMWKEGKSAIYLEISQFGLWYVPFSLLIVLLLHETYYYWVHRAMHHPSIYKTVHKVHHDSLVPTPWTAFSFHPWEAVLEAVFLPVILLIIPLNIYVLGFYLLLMTITSVINHLDMEVYSESFTKSKFGKLFINATHHHFHHSEFSTNYGLYFTFWDQAMKTESSQMPQTKVLKN